MSTVYGWTLAIAACVMLLRAIYERDLVHLWNEAGLPIVVGAAMIWSVVRWVARPATQEEPFQRVCPFRPAGWQ